MSLLLAGQALSTEAYRNLGAISVPNLHWDLFLRCKIRCSRQDSFLPQEVFHSCILISYLNTPQGCDYLLCNKCELFTVIKNGGL